MKFGYTIIYVSDVPKSIAYFENVFGFIKKFVDNSGDYGELDTGETTLSFAAHSLGESNLPHGYVAADSSKKPLGMEIAFVTDEIETAHQKAISQSYLTLHKQPFEKFDTEIIYQKYPININNIK